MAWLVRSWKLGALGHRVFTLGVSHLVLLHLYRTACRNRISDWRLKTITHCRIISRHQNSIFHTKDAFHQHVASQQCNTLCTIRDASGPTVLSDAVPAKPEAYVLPFLQIPAFFIFFCFRLRKSLATKKLLARPAAQLLSDAVPANYEAYVLPFPA